MSLAIDFAPEVTLRQTTAGARHVNIVDGDGRMSTPIQSFDRVSRTGVTATGDDRNSGVMSAAFLVATPDT